MSLFDDLLKGAGADKLKESLNELSEAVKKIDKSDLENALKELTDALPKEGTEAAPQEKPVQETVSDEQTAAQTAPSGANAPAVSYATANYDGIEKDDYYEELPEDELDCRTKILEVLATDFPEYEVREDISPKTLGGTGKFMNYTLGLYKEGSPKLFIMLIGRATTRHREYRWSKEMAAKAGVEMINFIQHAPNRYWYIAERLRSYL